MSQKINDNELGQKDDIIQDVFCLHCDEKTLHTIFAHEYITTESEEDPPFIEIEYYSQIIVCRKRGCKNSSLRTIRKEKGKVEIIDCEYFPGRKDKGYIRKYLQYGGVFDVESKIPVIYKESIDAYSNLMNFSAGAAIRSLLEEICKNRGHKEKVKEGIAEKMLRRKRSPLFQDLNDEEKKTVLKILIDSYNPNENALSRLDEIVQKINSEKVEINNVELDDDEIKTVEIRANLSLQIDKLKLELEEKRANTNFEILYKIIDWGNETIHGSHIPSSKDIKAAIKIIEFIFHALYVDEAEEASFSEHSSEFTKKEDEN